MILSEVQSTLSYVQDDSQMKKIPFTLRRSFSTLRTEFSPCISWSCTLTDSCWDLELFSTWSIRDSSSPILLWMNLHSLVCKPPKSGLWWMNMCANIFFFFFKQNLNKVYFVNKPLFQYCKYKYIVKKKIKKKICMHIQNIWYKSLIKYLKTFSLLKYYILFLYIFPWETPMIYRIIYKFNNKWKLSDLYDFFKVN